jgi:hypothetical protein
MASLGTASPTAGPTKAQGQPPNGTIRWLFDHEARGQSLEHAHITLGSTVGSHWQPVQFARVLTPGPTRAGEIVVSLIGKHGRNICMTLFEKDRALGGGCAVGTGLRPFSEMRFNTAGHWGIFGLASDDVARMVLLLPGERHVPVPLNDNAFLLNTKTEDVPSTLVAYDEHGLVISRTTQPPIPHLPR